MAAVGSGKQSSMEIMGRQANDMFRGTAKSLT
jgi:hypothetical protein